MFFCCLHEDWFLKLALWNGFQKFAFSGT